MSVYQVKRALEDLNGAIESIGALPKSRESSIAYTEAQTAALWLREHLKKIEEAEDQE